MILKDWRKIFKKSTKSKKSLSNKTKTDRKKREAKIQRKEEKDCNQEEKIK